MTDRIYEQITGALIGLARAAINVEHTPGLMELIRRGLTASGNDDPAGLQTLLQQIHSRKQEYAPNCDTCEHPCGRTADYDLRLLKLENENIASLKLSMLESLRSLASLIPVMDETDSQVFFDCLCGIGEELTEEDLDYQMKRILDIDNKY